MFTKIFIHLFAFVFILYGFAFALFPDFMLLLVTDSRTTTSSASIDIRSTYGGISLTIGAMLHYLAFEQSRVRLALKFILLLMLLMASTRMIGMAVDGQANFVMYFYMALELLSASLALVLLRVDKTKSAI